MVLTRRCVLAQQLEYTHYGCNGHICGELAQRALLAVAVAPIATGVKRHGRHQLAVVSDWG